MPTPADNPFTMAAVAYIRRGWRVVPLDRPRPGDHRSGKKPPRLDWPRLCWSEAEAVAHWSKPGAGNIGIICGTASGIVALDFDIEAAGEAWQAEHADVTTYMVGRSNAGPGRFHAYFALPAGEPAPKSTDGAGWNFQSTGRQVVAPPSLHYTGTAYMVRCDAPPAAWKPEYLPAAEAHETEPGPTAQPAGPKSPADRIRGALEAVPADIGYPDWIKVGLALHSWDPTRGLALWRDWSATGTKYKAGECEAKWTGFNSDRVSVGTLFAIAKAHGWKPRGRALVDGYGPLPRKLVTEGALASMTRPELAVVCCVAVTMNTGAGFCRLKAATLAETCGCDERTIRRAVAALVDRGAILTTQTGGSLIFRWGVTA